MPAGRRATGRRARARRRTPASPTAQHTFAVRATDAAGNLARAGVVTRGRSTPSRPTTAIESGPAGLSNSASASFAFSADEAAGFECRLDEGDWAACTSPQAYDRPGRRRAHLRGARDRRGRQPRRRRPLRVDDRHRRAGDDDRRARRRIRATTRARASRSARDEAASFECRLDGGDWAACASPHGVRRPRRRRAQLRGARDRRGGQPRRRGRPPWTVDTVAPETTIDAGPPALTQRRTAASFEFSARRGGELRVQAGRGDWAACASPQALRGPRRRRAQLRGARDRPAGNAGQQRVRTRGRSTRSRRPRRSMRARRQLSNEHGGELRVPRDEAASFECRLDEGDCGLHQPAGYTGLADGAHSFDGAGDRRGRATSAPAARYAWTVDTVAPVTTIDERAGRSEQRPERRASRSAPTRPARASSAGSTPPPGPPARARRTTRRARRRRAHLPGAGDRRGRQRRRAASAAWTVDTVAPDDDDRRRVPASPTQRPRAELRVQRQRAGRASSAGSTRRLGAPARPARVRAASPTARTRSRCGRPTRPATPRAAREPHLDGRHASAPARRRSTLARPTRRNDATPTFALHRQRRAPARRFECRVDAGRVRGLHLAAHDGAAGRRRAHLRGAGDRRRRQHDATPASRTCHGRHDGARRRPSTAGPSRADERLDADLRVLERGGRELPVPRRRGAFAACTSPHTTAALADGAHTFEVRATRRGRATPAPTRRAAPSPSTPRRRTTTIDARSERADERLDADLRVLERAGRDLPVPRRQRPLRGLHLAAHDGGAGRRRAHVRGARDRRRRQHRREPGEPRLHASTRSRRRRRSTSGPTGPTNDSTPTFAFSSEPGASFQCRVDSAAFAACTLAAHDRRAGRRRAHVRGARDGRGRQHRRDARRAARSPSTRRRPQTTITPGPAGDDDEHERDVPVHRERDGLDASSARSTARRSPPAPRRRPTAGWGPARTSSACARATPPATPTQPRPPTPGRSPPPQQAAARR